MANLAANISAIPPPPPPLLDFFFIAGPLLSTVSVCFNAPLLKFCIPDRKDGEPPPLLALVGGGIFLVGIGGGPLAFNVLRTGAVLLGGGILPLTLRGGPFVLRGGGKLERGGSFDLLLFGNGGGEFGPGCRLLT